MVNKIKNQEIFGFELEKVEGCYLLVNNHKLIEIVNEEWFKEVLEKLSNIILYYYSDFQIYLAYANLKKDSEVILGYVYVKSSENQTGEEISDVNLNKAMKDLTKKYKEMDMLFVTIQTKKRKFKKLKNGDIYEHFHISRHLI